MELCKLCVVDGYESEACEAVDLLAVVDNVAKAVECTSFF